MIARSLLDVEKAMSGVRSEFPSRRSVAGLKASTIQWPTHDDFTFELPGFSMQKQPTIGKAGKAF